MEDGDIIEIDIASRTLKLYVSDEELAVRAGKLEHLKREASKFLRLYAEHASSAAEGAVRRLKEEI